MNTDLEQRAIVMMSTLHAIRNKQVAALAATDKLIDELETTINRSKGK